MVFHFERFINRTLSWLNLICSDVRAGGSLHHGLLADHPEQFQALTIYCLNLISVGSVLCAKLWYAAGPGKLLYPDANANLLRIFRGQILKRLTVYLLAIAVSLQWHRLGVMLCCLTPLLYLALVKIDRY